jgi:zinc protease
MIRTRGFFPALVATTIVATSLHAAPLPTERKVLANGLEVIVVESHAQPLVTVEVAVRTGSMTEPPEYNGLSHLFEHMLFKANAVVKSQEAWLAKSRALGLEWNGTTDTERVNYYFTTTSDNTAATMEFMRDAVVTPSFDPKELDKERVVVTGEMDRNESNPYYYLQHEGQNRLFFQYPSRKDPLGSRKTVLSTTVEQMRTIQQRYYVPNNSLLVVVGDVKTSEVFALAEKLFSTWKRVDDPFKKFPLVKHPPLPQTSVVLVQQPVQTVAGFLTWHGPSVRGDELPATYAADLLAFAVGEPSSKFQQATVQSGACLGANFSWQTQVNVG